MNITIIDYGAGNCQSVKYILNRFGIDPLITNDLNKIKSADKIILPGVGQAGAAMQALKTQQLDILIPKLKQPFLGICLGMQLLCNSSEEGSIKGLGIFDAEVKKFQPTVKIPHMGWNNLEVSEAALFKDIPQSEYVYFVHSYFATISKHTIATCNYSQPFSAAMANENFYGCQFHPEKSGDIGSEILKNFIEL